MDDKLNSNIYKNPEEQHIVDLSNIGTIIVEFSNVAKTRFNVCLMTFISPVKVDLISPVVTKSNVIFSVK